MTKLKVSELVACQRNTMGISSVSYNGKRCIFQKYGGSRAEPTSPLIPIIVIDRTSRSIHKFQFLIDTGADITVVPRHAIPKGFSFTRTQSRYGETLAPLGDHSYSAKSYSCQLTIPSPHPSVPHRPLGIGNVYVVDEERFTDVPILGIDFLCKTAIMFNEQGVFLL